MRDESNIGKKEAAIQIPPMEQGAVSVPVDLPGWLAHSRGTNLRTGSALRGLLCGGASPGLEDLDGSGRGGFGILCTV